MFCEKGVLKNFTGKYLCWSLFLVKLQAFSGIQIDQDKKRFQHRFFCEIWKIIKNIYFEKCLRTTASKPFSREKPHWLNKMRFIDIGNKFAKDRSSRPKLFYKKCLFSKNSLKNHKIHNKTTVSESRFEKSSSRIVINKRLLHRYFPVSFIKLLRGCFQVKFHPGMKLVPGWNNPCLRWNVSYCLHVIAWMKDRDEFSSRN